MRKLLHGMAIGLAGVSLIAVIGVAQADYPEREIRLIVPFAAGGSTDIVGRIVAEPLSQRLGQPIVIENRGGAGGTVGTRAAAQASLDGYTLAVATTSTHVVGPLTHGEVGYDPLEDFVPISLVGETPYVLIVHPDSGFESVQDVIEAARERPGELNFGSAGVGSTTHLASEMFADLAGLEMQHIPYEGNREATTALLGQEIDLLVGSFPAVYSQIEAGQVVPLGVGTGERVEQMPDVPTMEEGGVEGYRASLWLGIAAPAGTPDEIVEQLHSEIVALIEEDEATREALSQNGADPVTSASPDEFRDLIARELETYERVVAGIEMTD